MNAAKNMFNVDSWTCCVVAG